MSGIIDLTPLLSAIYGTASSSSTVTSLDPLGDLKRAEANSTKEIAKTEVQPQVAKDLAAFRSAVASAKDPASLLKNPVVLKVLLTASGLADQIPYTALAQKALLSDTTDSNSVASQLTNTAWKTTAATYEFATKGLSVIQTASVLNTVADSYAEALWRKSLDTTTPGLSNALTFRSQAATITSADQILGDATLRTVVLTALGIPAEIAYQPLEAEEKAITDRLDISKFKDPAFVEKFTQRYLTQNTIALNAAASTTNTASPLSSYGYATSTDSTDTSTISNTLASLVVKSNGLIV